MLWDNHSAAPAWQEQDATRSAEVIVSARDYLSKVPTRVLDMYDRWLYPSSDCAGLLAKATPDDKGCSVSVGAHLGGRRHFWAEQEWQKTRPQRRQWWRRRTTGRKAMQQLLHSGAHESGIHCGGAHARMLSYGYRAPGCAALL